MARNFAARNRFRTVGDELTPEVASEPTREQVANGEFLALRAQIDAVNDEILRALGKRGELVLRMMKLKTLLGKPTIDLAREREMLDRLAASSCGPFSTFDVRRIFRAIIAASRGLGRRIHE